MTWNGLVRVHLPEHEESIPAGRLSLLEDGTRPVGSRFGYGARYLRRSDAVPIDPVSLPLSCQPGSQRLYEPPANLALFGAIRDAAPDLWGRRVIEAKLRAPPNALAESTYLLEAGEHRFGALAFSPTDQPVPEQGHLPAVTDLGYLLDAADRVQAGLPVPARLAMLFDAATLGGARPKAVVSLDGKQYLAKFPAKDDGFDVPAVERACLELARACGLRVPETKLITLPDRRNVMLIERFDRHPAGDGQWARRHCVSALTILGKGEQDSLGSSYAEIAQAISTYGVDGTVGEDRRELYARVAFSILVSNDDDHLRNHAFIWDQAGKGWRLSPLYDVVPHPQVAQERQLHLQVGPQGRAATLPNLLGAHGSFGLLKGEAARVIARVSGGVREWRTHFEETGLAGEQCDRIASAFRRPSNVGFDVIAKYSD